MYLGSGAAQGRQTSACRTKRSRANGRPDISSLDCFSGFAQAGNSVSLGDNCSGRGGRGGLSGGGRSLSRLSSLLLLGLELVKPLRHELAVRPKVHGRVKHVPASYAGHGLERGLRFGPREAHLTTPFWSMKNVTRASVRPRRPFPTWYALRASPFASLRMGY